MQRLRGAVTLLAFSALGAVFLSGADAASAAGMDFLDVDDVNALSALGGLIGNEFRAILEDMGVMKAAIEKESMIQLSDSIAPASVLQNGNAHARWVGKGPAPAPTVTGLLQEMERRFSARVEAANKHEAESKLRYAKLLSHKGTPAILLSRAKAMREGEQKESQTILRITQGGLARVQAALAEVNEIQKAGGKSGKGRSLAQIRQELVKFAAESTAEIGKLHKGLLHPRKPSRRHSLFQKKNKH